jgi:hypothetical protein
MQYRKEADLLDFYKRCTYFEMWPNDLPHNRRRDYDFLKGYLFEHSLARNSIEVVTASAVNAVVIAPVYYHGYSVLIESMGFNSAHLNT